MGISTRWKIAKYVSVGIAVLGVCTFIVLAAIEKFTAPAKLLMPGVEKVSLNQKGLYRIWYIYRWKSKNINSGFQEDIAAPILVECSSGHAVPIEHCTRGNHIGFSFENGEGEQLWNAHIQRPGIYEVSMLPTKQGSPFLISIVEEKRGYMDLGSNFVFKGLLSDY